MYSDQAAQLRKSMKKQASTFPIREKMKRNTARVLAVVSGKGGVGKSNFTVNFSLSLIEQHKKVLIIDLDLGMANIDILLGKASRYSMIDMIEQRMRAGDIIETTEEGLSYIAGGTALSEIYELNENDLDFFLRQLEGLENEYDVIILDLGAGINRGGTQMVMAAHDVIVVTTPEPTAMTDGYGMIKYIHKQNPSLPVHLLVNQCKNKEHAAHLAANLTQVCDSFLGKKIEFFGFLPKDEAVWNAVCAQKPFMSAAPQCKVSKAMKEIAGRFCGEPSGTNENSFVKKLKGWLKKR
ncbi:MinD/ParA family protein [Bacillus sp. H-16]|uniref:MinD/ParA family protein n=1 Tax=Alteribacter salitolerans TaxID=2912333 RepID=UPI0019667BBD|nr:MinD/ParA family protein [Alteribacter salitolerans]MBM7094192.1 MinD/ParA family protein [Alteribacter salitolerans]